MLLVLVLRARFERADRSASKMQVCCLGDGTGGLVVDERALAKLAANLF
ncbi:MAG: hypothetical protein K5905_30340 [Roseibium sp.]|nr:hypothetical protein [Roseibium sp.]MCV0429759.1 hypothetical protein [Roseibium sp.]